MNKKAINIVLALSFLVIPNYALADSNFKYTPQAQQNQSNLQGYALFVPAGVTCNAVLSQAINSKSAVVGQSVTAILMEDFTYNGSLIASSGSTIIGSIVQTRKAGFANRDAQIQIRFTTIRTPYNNIIPISAVIATSDSTGVLKAGTAKDAAKEYAKDTIIGAGAGAALGTAMGALSSGSVGKGAIYGTALGAGIGVIKGAANKGDDIVIPANSQINLLFDQPITLGAQ